MYQVRSPSQVGSWQAILFFSWTSFVSSFFIFAFFGVSGEIVKVEKPVLSKYIEEFGAPLVLDTPCPCLLRHIPHL